MSTLHFGRIGVARTATGRLEYIGESVDHALPGWPEPVAIAIPAVPFIPAQRRGSDGLYNDGEFVHIPTLSTFVREVLDGDETAKEARP